MTTVEKIDSAGNKFLVIEGTAKDHCVSLSYLKDVAARKISFVETPGYSDFIPKIIEEWLQHYSSERKQD